VQTVTHLVVCNHLQLESRTIEEDWVEQLPVPVHFCQLRGGWLRERGEHKIDAHVGLKTHVSAVLVPTCWP
jgi:hypothetical protein